MILVDWEKLARIQELQEHFESDFSGFKQCIHNYVQNLQKLTSPDLDKLAVLRVLEVTNGCAQWGFRRQDDQCLSTDQTRECMKKVMGFIKQGRITLPNGESIELVPSARQLFDQGRQLYQDAFKRISQQQSGNTMPIQQLNSWSMVINVYTMLWDLCSSITSLCLAATISRRGGSILPHILMPSLHPKPRASVTTQANPVSREQNDRPSCPDYYRQFPDIDLGLGFRVA